MNIEIKEIINLNKLGSFYMSTNYPDTHLFLNGEWREAVAKESLEIINPATEEVIDSVQSSVEAKELTELAIKENFIT